MFKNGKTKTDEEDYLVIYDYLILQHSALKCILDRKYDILMNVIIYKKFISKYLKQIKNGFHSQKKQGRTRNEKA